MEQAGITRPQARKRSGGRRRLFTVEHANRTLPLVQRIVADLVKQHKRVCALEERCHIRRPEISESEQERLSRQYQTELEKLRELAEELATVGCELKDWRRGLVDFACLCQGREVELCWQLGEERVSHWHEIGAGFPSRRIIDASFVEDCLQPVVTF